MNIRLKTLIALCTIVATSNALLASDHQHGCGPGCKHTHPHASVATQIKTKKAQYAALPDGSPEKTKLSEELKGLTKGSNNSSSWLAPLWNILK
jgi:hypothetical protein